MRKIALLCICTAMTASLISGCSQKTELAQYKGVEVVVGSREVTDDEVEAKINQLLADNPDYVEVDRAAQDGDTVNIDYKGVIDGEEFEGSSAEDQDLLLGSNRFIDGFEDGVIGMTKGETKDLDLTFPDNYGNKDLAGKPVVFTVTVNAVKEEQDAVLDDAFVQRVSEYQTVDELRAGTRSDLEAQKAESVENQKEQDVFNTVVENSAVSLDRSEVSKEYNAQIKNYQNQAKLYGTTLSGLAQSYGTDEGGFKEMVMASVKDGVKRATVADLIAEQEGIEVTEDDLNAFAEEQGMSLEDLKSTYGEDEVNAAAKQSKVLQYLAENAVEVEETAEATPAEAETTAAN